MGKSEASTRLLQGMRDSFRDAVGAGLRWVFLALLALAAVAAGHVARLGTPTARLGALLGLALPVGLYLWHRRRERLDWQAQRTTIARVLRPADPELAQRALRAVTLVERAERGVLDGAPELARAHYERLLASASLDAIRTNGKRRADRYRHWAWLLFPLALLGFALAPYRIAEGLNVLLAHRGRAPFGFNWLDRERIVATPPPYLRQLPGLLGFDSLAVLPQGTELTIRGRPQLQNRQLVLIHDQGEVPFADDGQGGVVAHYTVEQATTLRVAARYGEVLIVEPRELQLHAVADRAPIVELAQAPRTVKLAEIERLELVWTARDDHGLRQVDLVLRSGEEEERRNLAQYAGETRAERGAYTLLPHDAFLRRVFLPVSVSVEARDMSTLPGAGWGASQAITIELPAIGEAEARRSQALARARGALTDLFVWQEQTLGSASAVTEVERDENAQRMARTASLLEEIVRSRYAGLGIPRGMRNFVIGQVDALKRTRNRLKEARSKTSTALLALDAALGSLNHHDAEQVAKTLADVAEQAARAAKLARESEKRVLHLERLGQALEALGRSADQLVELGELGRDLGSIVRAGLRRIERAQQSEDLYHSELAALHLALRLRRPSPSYSSAGGSPGVESGSGQGGPAPPDTASEADAEFDQIAQQLAQLTDEHADALGQVNRTLDQARSGVDQSALREEALERANSLREVADGLPPPGGLPGTPQAEAALGREHLGGMAHALENLDLQQAVDSGKRASQVLREARRKAEGSALGEAIHQADLELSHHLEWAEARLQELDERARARARDSLSQMAGVEGELGERAEEILRQSRSSEAALPSEVEERLSRAQSLMMDAARSLRLGDGEQARKLQTQAQRLLEQAETGQSAPDQGDSGPEQRPSDRERGRSTAEGGDVPDPEPSAGPNEFRKRVLDGLAPGRGGRLGPAVQRYVEGLLQ